MRSYIEYIMVMVIITISLQIWLRNIKKLSEDLKKISSIIKILLRTFGEKMFQSR